ncbi:MAG: 50S ribosomal protein L24 [Bacteriovoracales bacterium]|nr:50S ribosomal protein L24 [Bacteriovoracales bacterium]
MQKLKQNDEVVVTAGRDRGKSGKIKKIYFKRNRVLVEGINMVKKTFSATQENPGGGIKTVERPIHRSNIMVQSPKTKRPTRVKIGEKDGKKVRIAVACGSVLP